MNKTYNPNEIESKWYHIWEQQGYFKASSHPGAATYSIVIPPPNVTGRLHMGHGFQHTLMDILIRYHRMQGDNTLWQVGTDHAGISTQMVVERQLATKNVSRYDIGREKFEQKIYDWKNESGGHITQQMRRLGNSTDWQRERFTMDDDLSHAVRSVFIQLYDEGLIYRGKRLVNWDPVLLTAISDVEVLSEERDGSLWHIHYPIENSSETLIVATTRPETMLGDTAVAVHPYDRRYQHLIGKRVMLPLTDRTIPIIADEYVDKEFATGCVKITPAHDFNDYQVGKRHNLEMINILTPDAKINENAPKAYQGLDRFIAREKIIENLQTENLLEKIEPHKLKLPIGDRGGAVIEPYLTEQWYVDIKPLAKPAIDAVKQGKIRFIPENWDKTYFQWMNNIQDWCISRQLWWGHRIPAWYDDADNIYVAESETAARQKYQLADNITLKQDNDVLDTWFSSALWPFSTMGWPKKTMELKQFYPTSVLVTGFDIIFFWVARMIMFGLKFTKQIPFHDVYITGLIRDEHGHKMSKTKGNVIDPIDLVDGISLENLLEKRTQGLMQTHMVNEIIDNTKKQFPNGIEAHGMDALRFTYSALASTGRDIRFDLGRLQGYRNFCNKIWNAARFVLMNTESLDKREKLIEFRSTGYKTPHSDQRGVSLSFENLNRAVPAASSGELVTELSIADQWIISSIQTTIKTIHEHLNNYRFDLASQAIYEFIWNEYCDWYLEFSKAVLYNDQVSNVQKRGTKQTLIQILEIFLRLLHPFMPFITEEIWQTIKPIANVEGETIMLTVYPKFDKTKVDVDAEATIKLFKKIIIGIRNIRGEMNIAPGKPVPLLLNRANQQQQQLIEDNKPFLMTLAKLESITWLNNETPPACATTLADNIELLIPITGLIDTEAEIARLNKEITKLQKDIQRSEQKLNNKNYIAKAPTEIVEKEREKCAEHQRNIQKLLQQVELFNN